MSQQQGEISFCGGSLKVAYFVKWCGAKLVSQVGLLEDGEAFHWLYLLSHILFHPQTGFSPLARRLMTITLSTHQIATFQPESIFGSLVLTFKLITIKTMKRAHHTCTGGEKSLKFKPQLTYSQSFWVWVFVFFFFFLIMAAISFAAWHSFQTAGMENDNLVYLKLERVYLALFPPQPNLNSSRGAIPHNRVWLPPTTHQRSPLP